MRYSASLGKSSRIITIATTALFAGIALLQFFTFSDEAKMGAYFSAFIMVCIYASAYVYRPSGYTLTESQLVVHRPIGAVTYPREAFEIVKTIPRENLKFTIRTFGVGGLWGYFGHFYNSAYGKMIWYVTRRDHLVLIKVRDKKTVLISPDDVDIFMKEFEAIPATT